MTKLEEKLTQIMSLVFEIPEDRIKEDSSPDDIENWDSIGAINLITAIEEEFDIEFDDEDLLEMLNFQLIKLKVKEKLNA